jgi:hypothetical protein
MNIKILSKLPIFTLYFSTLNFFTNQGENNLLKKFVAMFKQRVLRVKPKD